MICNNIIDKIPNLIRKEIDTNERIMIIEHLKNCNHCHTEYVNQLRIYYLIDKGLVSNTININKNQFYSELENKLLANQKSNVYKHSKIYIYAIAAVMIVIIFSILVFNYEHPVIKKTNENTNIEKALLNEDWATLQRILKSNSEIKKRADEKITISLLIEKLTRLEKQGIRSIDYIDLLNEVNNIQNYYPLSKKDSEICQIQVNKLVQTLESFKSSKSEITLYEIGLFLAETNKGGTKS